MRLRRFFTLLIPGAVAAGALTVGSTASLGQNLSGNGAIEIVGVASTAAISSVMQQLVQTVPSGYAANRRSSADGLASWSPSNTADAGVIASVVQISGSIVDLPVDSAGNDSPTKRPEPGENLVLAQFN